MYDTVEWLWTYGNFLYLQRLKPLALALRLLYFCVAGLIEIQPVGFDACIPSIHRVCLRSVL